MNEIIIIGPPCVGKGTVSSLIESKTNLKHVSVGKELRSMYPSDTAIGKHISQGGLADNATILSILQKYNHNIILDGFPRTIEQLQMIDHLKGAKIYVLTADKEILINRMLNRNVCNVCDKESHEKCEGTISKRLDDNIVTYNKRFDTYSNNIDMIKKHIHHYIEIDTSFKTAQQVADQILRDIS